MKKILRKLFYNLRLELFTDRKIKKINKKIEFEKDILSLLEKYGVFNNKHNSLQKAEIIVGLYNNPVIKLELLVRTKEQI